MTAEALPAAPRGIGLRMVLGLGLAAIVAVAGLVSLAWTPHGATLLAPLALPDAAHVIGTDVSGRDGLSLLMAATLATLLLAALGTLVSLLLGVPAGVVLALRRGTSRASVHAIAMLPPALLVGIVVGGLAVPANLVILLAIAAPGAIVAGTITRQALAPLWRRDFVSAARLAGLQPIAAAQRHVLPQLLPQLAALGLKLLAAAILIEIGLSFAGLGVLPPGVSLGLMLREGQPFLMIRPLLTIAPGAVAFLTALALMFAASGLRGARHGAA